MIKRTPLPPRKKPLRKSSKPIRQVNPTAKAKRVKKQQAHYASAEYKAARKEAMERAGRQCEAHHGFSDGIHIVYIPTPGDKKVILYGDVQTWRCEMREGLEFHEIAYGSDLGLIRPIRGVILCKADHAYIEMRDHPHRIRKWS